MKGYIAKGEAFALVGTIAVLGMTLRPVLAYKLRDEKSDVALRT